MPTSQPRTLTSIHTLVQRLHPQSIIDIGVGHGKTGVLLRDYLDVMKLRYRKQDWVTRIYGIEMFQAYHNPIWDYAYDSVLVCDAVEGLQRLPDVDLIMALDVWEHFERNYASEMLNRCLQKARYLLISTPKVPLPQSNVFDNPGEQHVSKWSPKDFADVRYRLATCTLHDWIILLSSRNQFPPAVRQLGSTAFGISEGFRQAVALWRERARSGIL